MQSKDECLKTLISQNSFSVEEAMALVREGANPDTQTKEGVYFLDLLCQKNADEAAKELVERYSANIALAFAMAQEYQKESEQLQITNQLLGSGSYSKVYLGEVDNQEIAVKLLLFTKDSFCKALESYANEVKNMITLKQAKAEYVVDFIGFNIRKPQNLGSLSYHILMEKGFYCSLDDLIQDSDHSKYPNLWSVFGQIGTRENIINGMAKGVAAIHPYFVHADLKPANVLLTQTLEAKLIDFGFSRPEGYKEHRGTSDYKAPEILFGKFSTNKSDVFSLGVSIWETMHLKCIDFPFYVVTEGQLLDYLQAGHRAYTSEEECSFKMAMLTNVCWDNNPDKRPTAKELSLLLGLPEEAVFKQLKSSLRTPLTLACKYARLHLVKELISVYTINELYQEASTPLLAASRSSLTHNNEELFDLLLQNGADIYAQDRDGKTALDNAFATKNDSAINVLLAFVLTLKVLEKPIMSNDTIALAKQWVHQYSKELMFDVNFFNNCLTINVMTEKSNQEKLASVNTKQEFYAAIHQIGFFPSANRLQDKMLIEYKVKEYTHGNSALETIPRTYGLRNKAYVLFQEQNARNKIDKVNSKEELYKALEEIKVFKTTQGLIDTSLIKSFVEGYFNGTNGIEEITRTYGLRAKVEIIKATLSTQLSMQS